MVNDQHLEFTLNNKNVIILKYTNEILRNNKVFNYFYLLESSYK